MPAPGAQPTGAQRPGTRRPGAAPSAGPGQGQGQGQGKRRGSAARSRRAAGRRDRFPPFRRVLRRGSPARRLNVTLICIIFALSLFAGRLVQLQGLDWSTYRQLAEQQRLIKIPIPAVRGAITTSDGKVLAMTVQTDVVFADPALIAAAKRPAIAAALAGPLAMPPARILQLINEHGPSPDYVALKAGVPAATGSRIISLDLPGINETPSYSRVYPNGDLAANLLGFTDTNQKTGELHGTAGVEYADNSLLAGKDGEEDVETGSQGQPIPLTQDDVHPQVPAENLRLTIQSDLQWEAQQACKARVRLTHAANCSIVIMDPKTGKILAMAQWPEFNPAAPKSVASTTDIPVADVFEPGSTAKVVTVAAALERGGQTPMSVYRIPDQIKVDGAWYHDAEIHPTVHYTVAGILANSSNVGMVQVVQHVSPSIQYQYYKKLGFGSVTGLGLPGESPGLLQPPSQWSADTRYTLSFGQGVGATAVQMASLYAAIANGGVRVQPSIIAGHTNSEGRYVTSPRPRRTRVLKTRTARELMRILQQVPMVDVAGSEPWGVIAGYSIAAKTGTAQLADPQRGGCLCEYGSSYIGIAPATDPQLVVAVHVQDPKTSDYFGDEVAGPVFNQVMKFALQTMKIPPDGGKRPKVRLTAP
jgi:cell division protein FtsI (penicillin-binding protein 3)